MKIKTICFIAVPLIFFGCGAYQIMHRPEESIKPEKVPKNKEEMQKQIEKFHGSKR